MTIRLWSDEFVDGGHLSLVHACNGWGHAGANRSPHFGWGHAPPATESFALTMFDPDPGSDLGFWHWFVVNIPAPVSVLPPGAGSGQGLPAGALQIRTDYGEAGYGGPAPGAGHTNRYHFTLHALSVARLELDANAPGGMTSWMINSHSLAKARIVALYAGPPRSA